MPGENVTGLTNHSKVINGWFGQAEESLNFESNTSTASQTEPTENSQKALEIPPTLRKSVQQKRRQPRGSKPMKTLSLKTPDICTSVNHTMDSHAQNVNAGTHLRHHPS